MSARSFLTARLMETWAHGQDVVDALGADRPPTDRLRHVAHIGVAAGLFSYVANGVTMPDTPGFGWSWTRALGGHVDVGARGQRPIGVSGPALGFCLLVTQRRHRDDVDVRAEGAAADEWLGIAQAFAGPPGAGRQPGQVA